MKESPLTLRVADWLGRGRGRLRWLDHVNPPARASLVPDLKTWADHELAAAWIGHATVLLRLGGMTIITDPVLANRVGLGLGLMTGGPRRHVAAALTIKQLPRIDLILLSHAHYDHLDRPTLVRLSKRIPVVTAEHTSDLIRDLGFSSIREMRWGETTCINGLKITAQRVRHWGARSFYDRHRGVNGYLLEAGRRRVLFGGDTAYQDWFKEIGKVDLGIFGIGAYNPFIQAHATPEEAWTMAQHVGADAVMPMHHSTFRLSHEPMREPLERILTVAGNEAERVVIKQVGGMWAA